MRRNGIVLAVLALMLVTVLSSGCTGNAPGTTETTPLVTTVAPAAIELHKQGSDALINGNYTEALDLYNMAIAVDPGYTRAWLDKGNTLLVLNRSAEAIAVYDVVLAREDFVPNVWNNRGKALMATGNYSAALDSFEKAIQQSPEFTEAKENRDLVLEKMQQGEQAGPVVTGQV
jgi:tetratricopeptide (TPR) repeat protein